MKALKYTLLILIIISLNKAIAQKVIQKPIIISGSISEELMNGLNQKFLIRVSTEMIAALDENLNKNYPVQLKNNSFRTIIQPTANYQYVQIEFAPINMLSKTYLVKPGDTIKFEMRDKKDFSFKSNTSLFSCQLELNQMAEQLRASFTSDTVQINKQKAMFIKALNAILKKYSETLSGTDLEILRVNYLSDFNYSVLKNLNVIISRKVVITNAAHKMTMDYLNNIYNRPVPKTNVLITRNAIQAVRYYYNLEKLWNGIDTEKKDSFEKMYNATQRRYSGLFKEKLTTFFFLRSFNQSYDANKFLKAYLTKVNDPLYKKILLNLQNSTTAGNDAYPFELESEDGKMYKLSDLKNKVLVCKFWYNGCGPCIELEKNLKPLKEKYKNSEVLFVSINVNSDRSSWIKGIEQGIYTSKPDLMLSTYGLGSQHPILEFYHFNGYPQLLLIDKMGKIISSKPVKPSNPVTLAKLDELIKAHL